MFSQSAVKSLPRTNVLAFNHRRFASTKVAITPSSIEYHVIQLRTDSQRRTGRGHPREAGAAEAVGGHQVFPPTFHDLTRSAPREPNIVMQSSVKSQ